MGYWMIMGGVVIALLGSTAGGYTEAGQAIANPVMVVGGIALGVFGLIRAIRDSNREDAEANRARRYQDAEEQRMHGYRDAGRTEARLEQVEVKETRAPFVAEVRSSTASSEEIDRVAEKLSYYLETAPDLLKDQRMVPLDVPAFRHVLEADGLMEAAEQAGLQRRQEISTLMEKYGDAVRRVPGADPQDLLVLKALGHIPR